MASRLAGTVFQTNGREAMLAQDAYGISNQQTKNTVFDSLKGVYSEGISGLQTNPSSIKQLTQLILSSKNGNVDKADMLDRALSAMGSSLPALIGSIAGGVKNQLAGAAGTLIGPGAEKAVNVVYGNLGKIVKVATVNDLSGLADVLNELTGNSELMKVINIEAEAAVLGGLMGMLIQYDIPGLLDDVANMAGSSESLKLAYQYVSTDSIVGTDLATINRVIDKIGLAAYLEVNPNPINTILSGFYFGTGDTVDTYPTKRALLISTLNRIDPHWEEYNRNGVYVKNLSAFSVASTDAKTLLNLAEPESILSMIAPSFLASSVSQVIKALYPDAYVT
jgi:hypothetical protein